MRDPAQRYWQRRAGALAVRVNFAHWLDAFVPAFAVVSAACAAAVLVVRGAGSNPGATLWSAAGGALIVAGAFAALRARQRFFSRDDAIVRLDVALGLKNRLGAASRGVGMFPQPLPLPDGLRWRPWRHLGCGAACGAAVLLAAAIPIDRPTPPAATPIQPSSWSEVSAWIERLEEAEIVEPEALETLEEKLATLREAPSETWFQHASLEAGDALREQVAAAAGALGRDLAAAASALDAAAALDASAPGSPLAEVRNRLGAALDRLALGDLPVDSSLARELRDFDPANSKQLSSAEMAALRERLERGVTACQSGGMALVAVPGDTETGDGSGTGPGTPDDASPAPLAFDQNPTDLGSSNPEALDSADLSRALPADVLAVTPSARDHDPAPDPGVGDGGRAAATGPSGDAVARDRLDPAERELLGRFFR